MRLGDAVGAAARVAPPRTPPRRRARPRARRPRGSPAPGLERHLDGGARPGAAGSGSADGGGTGVGAAGDPSVTASSAVTGSSSSGSSGRSGSGIGVGAGAGSSATGAASRSNFNGSGSASGVVRAAGGVYARRGAGVYARRRRVDGRRRGTSSLRSGAKPAASANGSSGMNWTAAGGRRRRGRRRLGGGLGLRLRGDEGLVVERRRAERRGPPARRAWPARPAAGTATGGGAARPPGPPPACRSAAQQVLHLGDQRLRLERLGQEPVAADARRALLVEGLEGAGQQQHRDVRERRVLLDEVADLVAVLLRHDDVAEHDVGRHLLDPLEARRPLPTVTTSKSSSEKVSSMTFWMVMLSSASRIFLPIVVRPPRATDARTSRTKIDRCLPVCQRVSGPVAAHAARPAQRRARRPRSSG